MKPYYEKTLEDFPDEVITRVFEGQSGGFYAVLDSAPLTFAPDFVSYGGTQGQAIKKCADKIRADARGIGKYAPHPCLIQSSYDFRFRLCRHWTEKQNQ